MLTTWRETDHSEERWGGCKYEIKPRKRTVTSIKGSWVENLLLIYGSVAPTPYVGHVQIRLAFEGEKSYWVKAGIEDGGSFKVETSETKGSNLETMVHYEGSDEFGPSTSEVLHLKKTTIS